jgi:hypothetical protein
MKVTVDFIEFAKLTSRSAARYEIRVTWHIGEGVDQGILNGLTQAIYESHAELYNSIIGLEDPGSVWQFSEGERIFVAFPFRPVLSYNSRQHNKEQRMFIFEEGMYAPEWIKDLIESNTNGRVKIHQIAAYAVVRIYDQTPTSAKMPVLRDKTEMVRKMFKGFGYPDNRVFEQDFTGAELAREFKFPAVGAQFVQNFKIMWKELN